MNTDGEASTTGATGSDASSETADGTSTLSPNLLALSSLDEDIDASIDEILMRY